MEKRKRNNKGRFLPEDKPKTKVIRVTEEEKEILEAIRHKKLKKI